MPSRTDGSTSSSGRSGWRDRPADLLHRAFPARRPIHGALHGYRRARARCPLSGVARMSRICVVRHGEASWHAEDYDQLTDKGHAQARAVGAELAARGIRPMSWSRGPCVGTGRPRQGCSRAPGGTTPWPRTTGGTSRRRRHRAGACSGTRDDDRCAGALLPGGEPPGTSTHSSGEAMVRWFETGSGLSGVLSRVHPAGGGRAGSACFRTRALGQAVVVTSGGVGNSIASQVLGRGAETWMRIFGTFPTQASCGSPTLG